MQFDAASASAPSASYLLLFGRLTLALFFGLSGATKLASMPAFIRAVQDFHLLPVRLIPPFAVVVVAAEIWAAMWLLLGIFVQGALIVLVALLILFTGALVHALREGREVVCRCFGELSARPASWSGVLRNVLLGATVVVALVAAPADIGGTLTVAEALMTSLLAFGALAVLALTGEAGVLLGGRSRAQRTATMPRSVLTRLLAR